MFASMPFLLLHSLEGDGESVRVSGKEVAIHVITSGNSRGGFLACFERVTGVDGDAAGIHNTYRIEHRAPILIKEHIVTDGFTNDPQADALGLKSGRIRLVVEAFNRAVIHEIQLDVANAPDRAQNRIGLAQIILRTGMGAVKNVKWIQASLASDDPASMNRLASGIMDQPVFVIFVEPGALGDLKRSGPDSRGQTQHANFALQNVHAAGKQASIGCYVLSARVLIALVDVEEVIAQILQILCQPMRVGYCRPLIEAEIESSPTPPARDGWSLHARMMQLADEPAIVFQLLVIVCAGADQKPFGRDIRVGRHGQAQLDLVFSLRLFKGIFFGQFRSSRRIHFVGSDVLLTDVQAEDGKKFLGRKRSQKEISLGLAVVNQLATDRAMHS